MGKLARLLTAVAVVLAALGPASAARADIAPPCPPYGDLHICSAQVVTPDGSPLDVDVTQPMPGTRSPHPLMVMLHGFGNDKHEWESETDEGDGGDKWHWNNHWFAEHGYYVLAYTARGFKDQFVYKVSNNYSPNTPDYTSDGMPPTEGTIHLKSVEYEIRDTQFLAALVRATFPDVSPNVAVTGGSYGGGESWTQASDQQDWNAKGMTLQVAIPKYPWTDLAYSLAPNGHPTNTDIYESSQGEALPDPNSNNADSNPFGVPKASYVAVFFGEGVGPKGDFENDANPDSREVQQDGPISLEAWMARASKDPYNEDPNGDLLMKQIRRGLTIFRSSYYQAPGWAYEKAHGNEVAIFSISGWTDALFPPVESFRQFLYLKSSAVDPMWPVSLAVADVGHPPAENKPETWHRLNVQAWQFLQSNINGAHRQMTTVYSEATVCANGSDPNVSAADQLTATSPQALSAGQLSVGYSGGDTFSDISGAGDLDSAATDPIVNFVVEPSPHCPQSVTPSSFGRYSGTSDPLTQNLTYVGLGQISIPYTGWTDTELQLDARVYDVAPDGSALLITRGTYRMAANYDVPGAGTVTLPLFGNEYPLDPGHRVRIDLAEQDYPYLLPNTSTGATPNITIAAPTLTLPLRQAVQLQMAGTQTSG